MEFDLGKTAPIVCLTWAVIVIAIIIWSEITIIGALIWVITITTAIIGATKMQKAGIIPSTAQIKTILKNRPTRIRNPKMRLLTKEEAKKKKKEQWKPKW